MGVKCSVELATTKTVVKSVSDATVDGYESAYSGYFNAVEAPAPEEGGGEAAVRRMDSLDDPKDCTD
jgi:hypothetical protein